jgi:hypothetical protein
MFLGDQYMAVRAGAVMAIPERRPNRIKPGGCRTFKRRHADPVAPRTASIGPHFLPAKPKSAGGRYLAKKLIILRGNKSILLFIKVFYAKKFEKLMHFWESYRSTRTVRGNMARKSSIDKSLQRGEL